MSQLHPAETLGGSVGAAGVGGSCGRGDPLRPWKTPGVVPILLRTAKHHLVETKIAAKKSCLISILLYYYSDTLDCWFEVVLFQMDLKICE